MSRIAPAITLGKIPPQLGQPGSNGYLRRDAYYRPGTFTWTAKKDGKIKIQAIGAACGGKGDVVESSAAWGEKTLSVVSGQTLTLVLASGSAGTTSTNPVQAGSTSISGAPVGGTPLVLLGASLTVAGSATGPWDSSNPGAAGNTALTGSPSSGSPFGQGFQSTAEGGAGWGGGSAGTAGASSHAPCSGGKIGAPGLTTKANSFSTSGAEQFAADGTVSVRPIWDMADADSAGATSYVFDVQNGYQRSTSAGPGAGGGYGLGTGAGNARAGSSSLGGGTGFQANTGSGVRGPKSGFGGGGCGSSNSGVGGDGGDAVMFIFWDEAA